MDGISPWVASVKEIFAKPDLPHVYELSYQKFVFKVYNLEDSLWIVANWPQGGRMAFRAAYSPNDHLQIKKINKLTNEVTFTINSLMGAYVVKLNFMDGENPVFRYTTTLKPATPLLFPFWPRDIIPLGKEAGADLADGRVFTSQVGTRSGLLYMSLTRPKTGSVLYFQNLTALAEYCQQTETSSGNLVGGKWPEVGFALPVTKQKPLAENKEVVLSDAFVALSTEVPDGESDMVQQYLDMLASVYLQLPKPDTHYKHWPDILNKGLKDLIENHGCWAQVAGHSYFNAYVCDYITPPEIMVQLAVLLPLLDYVEWSDTQIEIMKKIKEGLPAFYDPKYKTIMRWHPATADKLEGEEEQKKPLVMDSWYLHHPLLNLSRLALKGDKVAEKLFLDSLEFAIRVAHHFKYQWPVFYKMDTLEVIKAETQPGKGGQKDVPGIYAHVMMQAWELTGKKKYLEEAERSAKKLEGLGFELFYQGNNTAFSAGALLRLYKATNNNLYLKLSYLCLANIFKNVQLWDCNYGYGKNFPSFFAVFPLSDAPYTAVYEEQEIFCALHEYLRLADGVDILPSVSILVSEFIRYLVDRAVYYYPPMLPAEMLADKPKIGELDPDLWIALEDMHDGWEKCGTVGQEVYGAGNAFGILPRHYIRVPGESFMIYVDYPIAHLSCKKGKPISFTILGDNRLTCRLRIVKMDKHKLPSFKLIASKRELAANHTKEGHLEYIIFGNQKISICWGR